jgi:hypothetical protein
MPSFRSATAAYVLAAAIFTKMALVGWHEEGIRGAWHFVLLACLPLAQAVQRTLLG